jgi:peptidyl-prolyl cis-trans isomerase D
MRENTKWIMLIVVIAFVGLMVFEWGMDMSGRSSPSNFGLIGTVNGTPITYQNWTLVHRNLADQVRDQKGEALNDVELDVLEEQTWNQLINQILIAQELKRRKITVTDEEVRLAFRTTPPEWLRQNELFQTDGQFDYEKYQGFFSGPAADTRLLAQIEAYYRDVLPRARLIDQVSTGIYISDSETWAIYRENTEQARVRYVSIDPETRIDDSGIEIGDDDLRRFYRQNSDDFRQPAVAETRLVQIFRLPVAADSAAALETAYRIHADILAGADFAEQAAAHSGDRATASNGGDLGWFERGDMADEFEQAAYALETGEMSEPAKTQFGYHIIKVTDRESDRLRASHILIRIEMGGSSEGELLGRVDRIERIGLTQGLAAAADSLGVSAAVVSLAQGTEFVPGIGRFGPAHDWAFHDSTLIGDLSPIYEAGDAFYVFELDDRKPEGMIAFEEAEASIRRRVMQEKKTEKALELAAEMAARLSEGVSLEVVALENGLELKTSELFTRGAYVTDLGQANAAIGTAFGLGVNEVAGPIEANGLIHFIEVAERVDADREAFELEKEPIRAQLALRRRQSALENWLAAIKLESDIVDNRREFFRPQS